MAVYKDNATGMWRVLYRFTNWKGERKQTQKRDAVNFYNLPYNPARWAGTIGTETPKEMDFWTKDEYLKFAEAMMDKPRSFYAFERFRGAGFALELLALTPADFDFKDKTVRINKTFHRSKGKDIITSPKTAKSNRKVKMSSFLCEEIQEYIHLLYDIKPT